MPEPQPSFVTRTLRWLADFERVMEVQPYDHLEFRITKLERRLATPNLSDNRAQNPFPARAAKEN